MICCAVHCAVGCSVTLKWTIHLRSWASTTSTNSIRNVAVGRVRKLIYTNSRMCWSRNVLQLGDGGPTRFGRYFSTVDLAVSNPSIASSATIFREPQVGLARHVHPMSSPSSRDIRGRPGLAD